MSIPPAFLDELRARVGLVDLVRGKVKLTKAGHEWKGCCPFHNEKTASFYVNEDKGFYHCFGCGAHGDAIRFVVEQDGLRFPEAVRYLADRAGLQVPEPSPEHRAQADARKALVDIATRAARFFVDQLAGADGEKARRYLADRALEPATVLELGIGYAPPGNRLKAAFRDVAPELLVEAGLLGWAAERREHYDRFRDRVMFPVLDPRGAVVGFSARAIGAGEPKYLNSPDGPLFDKGRLLYNVDRAGPIARRKGRLFVVEGQMDVAALVQAGVGEATAPLGTAVTEAQLLLAWRAVPEPVLCFDGDKAGKAAAERAILRALPLLRPGFSLSVLTMPPGQDPDELVRAGGRAAFEQLAGAAVPLIEALWRGHLERADLSTPERRAALKQDLDEVTATIADPDVRQLYQRELRSRFFELTAPRRNVQPQNAFLHRGDAYSRGRGFRSGMAPVLAPPGRAKSVDQLDDELAAALAIGVIARPSLAHDHSEQLAEVRAPSPAIARLLRDTLIAATEGPDRTSAELEQLLEEGGWATEIRRARATGQGIVLTRLANNASWTAFELAVEIALIAATIRRVDRDVERASAALRAEWSDVGSDAQRDLVLEREKLRGLLRDATARQAALSGAAVDIGT